ncbi:MAG: M14 family metallopeptidase [Pseudomonadota bacterium]
MLRLLALAATLVGASAFAGGDYESPLWPDTTYDPSVPTIESVLGYAPGSRISHPSEVMRYFEALASAVPDRIQIEQYASSWQGRPLIYAVVTDAENLARIDEIKAGMQSLQDPRKTPADAASELIDSLPAVTWLSYSVHGNEISPADAAMVTAYHLLAAQGDARVDAIMNETVVVIDPVQNPDGRARFVSHFENNTGLVASNDRIAAEHDEPWPGGRTNHYLFDMNRDWFILTQPETRGRIAALQEWYPVAFVDAHEMGSDSTYYFSPEAKPFNPHIAADQRASLELFGLTNAGLFDSFGIDYFTREIFDALYPGYGASWPLYFGSIAMTYEQASARGLRVRQYDGNDMHYSETVRNHFVASMGTAETVQVNRRKFLQEFYDYQVSAIAEGRRERTKAYVIPAQSDQDAADKLAGLLVMQGVEVGKTTRELRTCGNEYAPGSYVINLDQPAKRLLRTLMDSDVPIDERFMEEQERRRAKGLYAELYDVTAWSLPLMMNVRTDTCTRRVAGDFEAVAPQFQQPGTFTAKSNAVTYLVPWTGAGAVRLAVSALQAGYVIKTTDKAFTHQSVRYPAGTVIIDVADNDASLGSWLSEAAATTGSDVVAVADTWVTDGPNFGSENVQRLPSLEVAIAWDDPVSPYSAGNTRFVIEQQFGLPVTPIRLSRLGRADLRRYHVLILPEVYGSYRSELGTSGIENLTDWVADGGVLITLGNATRLAADPDVDWLPIRREYAAVDEDAEAGSETDTEEALVEGSVIEDDEAYAAAIEGNENTPDSVPGVLLRAKSDPDHWLAAGVAETLNVLVRGSDVYTPAKLGEATNVVRFEGPDELLAGGYLWAENADQLAYKPFVVHDSAGRGEIIGFTYDPTVRAYLDGLNMIFMNAIIRGAAHARPIR